MNPKTLEFSTNIIFYIDVLFNISAGMITQENGKYSIAQYDFGQYRTRFQLTIHNFGREDLGMYKCICNNPISSRVEGDVQLVLEPGIKLYILC